jgi:hypothetical protein
MGVTDPSPLSSPLHSIHKQTSSFPGPPRPPALGTLLSPGLGSPPPPSTGSGGTASAAWPTLGNRCHSAFDPTVGSAPRPGTLHPA